MTGLAPCSARLSRQRLMVICSIALGAVPLAAVSADSDGGQAPKTQRMDGQTVIILDQDTQKTSGLLALTVQPASYRPEFTAYGQAVNIQPLLALRNQYRVALTEQGGTRAKLIQSEQSVKRVQELYREGIAAKRNLQEQQSQWQADKARVEAGRFQAQAIIDEALLKWGKPLTEWAMSADSGRMNAFLSGRQTLLQITLPANRQLPEEVDAIYVEASGDRGKAQQATLISMAPQSDNPVQGPSYFFRTGGGNIRTGASVSAWIPEQTPALHGVIIPKSALIWSMDQTFVYIKNGEDAFSRRAIARYSTAADGYFVSDAIKPGEQIVTTGGQMLLSEELRGQIPDEDD